MMNIASLLSPQYRDKSNCLSRFSYNFSAKPKTGLKRIDGKLLCPQILIERMHIIKEGRRDRTLANESWEEKCCRCESTKEQSPTSGKRACHITCGSCVYPGDWSRCVSCEIVGHCALALEHFKSLPVEKGCSFAGQLTGEETLYHTLDFVQGQQTGINKEGEEKYLKRLRKENKKSKCLNMDKKEDYERKGP
jgi:hypothetical protein